jgi:hypothetical protein
MTSENIEPILKTWKTSRKLYLDYFDKYSSEQLNKVPRGFNNNLIWNIGHVIVAQQVLIYKTSGLEGYVSDELLGLYKPGTKPNGKATKVEVEELKRLLTVLIDKTVEDLNKGLFTTFNERMTGTGFHLGSLTEAFHFNNYHEGLHLGCMAGIRKFV